ncbi:hypothetical protein ACVNF4_27200 [Streptomyces sp. S6]
MPPPHPTTGVGYDPQAIPGVDGEALRAALDAEPARFGKHGIDATMTLLVLDESIESTLAASLAEQLIRRHAPQAATAFNTGGGDSVETAQRRLRIPAQR